MEEWGEIFFNFVEEKGGGEGEWKEEKWTNRRIEEKEDRT